MNSKKLNPQALNMDEVVLQEKMEQPELNHDDVVMQDLETKEEEEELDAQVTYACTKCPKVFGNYDAMSNAWCWAVWRQHSHEYRDFEQGFIPHRRRENAIAAKALDQRFV